MLLFVKGGMRRLEGWADPDSFLEGGHSRVAWTSLGPPLQDVPIVRKRWAWNETSIAHP
jgi:hypothetical protein